MTETVRSVSRSLRLMATLNRNNGATLNWLAKATGLSRGTTYRMLETFVTDGFAVKDPNTRGYWLTEKVQGLSDGYAATGWIMTVAKPQLEGLGRAVVWPLSLCVPSGTDMVVKMTTDHDTPLTMELISAGLRMPMATSAAGRAYLAFCPTAERDLLIKLLQRTLKDDATAAAIESPYSSTMLDGIRRSGCAAVEGTHRVSNIAVPILVKDTVLGCIVLRFYTSTMTLAEAIKAHLEPMQSTAAAISRLYLTEHSGAA